MTALLEVEDLRITFATRSGTSHRVELLACTAHLEVDPAMPAPVSGRL